MPRPGNAMMLLAFFALADDLRGQRPSSSCTRGFNGPVETIYAPSEKVDEGCPTLPRARSPGICAMKRSRIIAASCQAFTWRRSFSIPPWNALPAPGGTQGN